MGFRRLTKKIKAVKLEDKMKIIHKKTCSVFNVRYLDTFYKSRKPEIVAARQVTMSVTYNNFNCNLQSVADFFHKDHATVIHSRKTTKNLIDTERDFCEKYKSIEEFTIKYFKIKQKPEVMSRYEILNELKKLIYRENNINLTINANRLFSQL